MEKTRENNLSNLNIQEIIEHETKMLAADRSYDPAADPVVRASGIGGSEKAAILNLDGYRSPLDLWAMKRGILDPENIDDKMPIRLGRQLEDDICEMFAEDQGLKLRRYRKTPRHSEFLYEMAHPDRQVVGKWKGKRAVVEAKFTGRVDDWGQPGTDEIPRYYLPQVHQEMWVTNSEVCLVPVWLCNFRIEPAWYVVERSAGWDDLLQQAGAEFWRHVVDGTEPPVDYSQPATQRAISKIYGQAQPNHFRKLGAEDQEIATVLDSINKRLNALKATAEEYKAMQTHRMAGANFGQLPDGNWLKRISVSDAVIPEYARDGYDYLRKVKGLGKEINAYIPEDFDENPEYAS